MFLFVCGRSECHQVSFTHWLSHSLLLFWGEQQQTARHLKHQTMTRLWTETCIFKTLKNKPESCDIASQMSQEFPQLQKYDQGKVFQAWILHRTMASTQFSAFRSHSSGNFQLQNNLYTSQINSLIYMTCVTYCKFHFINKLICSSVRVKVNPGRCYNRMACCMCFEGFILGKKAAIIVY